MTRGDFIKHIAPLIQRHAPRYDIAVVSPVIAQAALESAYGTSELALKACNYFGLKYSAGRCPTASGIYVKDGAEQNADGSYTNSPMQWCRFPDMESGVIGYFDFINTPRYANLKGVKDARTYLEMIKADGYATSLRYVENLMVVIRDNDLTRFDEGVTMYTNSPLATVTKISPNKYSPRNHTIDTITIHCMAGNLSVETCGDLFMRTSTQASSNYGVGTDGRVGLYVEEKDASWCSSNKANDMRAVTIEVANNGGAPDWPVSDKALKKTIELCADICRRNGKSRMTWIADKKTALAYEPQPDEMRMTVHRWFAAKACPGDYLMGKMAYIADEVTRLLGGQPSKAVLYRVQVGAYKVKDNAVRMLRRLEAAGEGGIIVRVGDLYKVQVGAFAVKANADRKSAALKSAGYSTYITTEQGDMIAV